MTSAPVRLCSESGTRTETNPDNNAGGTGNIQVAGQQLDFKLGSKRVTLPEAVVAALKARLVSERVMSTMDDCLYNQLERCTVLNLTTGESYDEEPDVSMILIGDSGEFTGSDLDSEPCPHNVRVSTDSDNAATRSGNRR